MVMKILPCEKKPTKKKKGNVMEQVIFSTPITHPSREE